MAKFSMKKGGKEVGSADVYAQPHDMSGREVSAAQTENGYASMSNGVDQLKVSVGNINRAGYSAGAKTDGIEIRGVGAATKGTKARGPMA